METILAGGQVLFGTAGHDMIAGGSGDDRISGGSGNDAIDGGAGSNDIAIVGGLQDSYTLATSNGIIIVVDDQPLVDGNDGTDNLVGVEKIEFKGGAQIALAAPIILDLNGNGVSLIDDRNTDIGFDWDGDGRTSQTGWIGKDDGFLFVDRDGNGTVTDAGELRFTSDREGAKSDLDGLRAFDSNGDGVLSSADERFAQFMVWQDKNGSGRVDDDEILPLEAAVIASVNLTGEAINRTWEWGENITLNSGTFRRLDGTIGTFGDVALSYDAGTGPSAAIARAASQLSEAMAHFGGVSGTDEFGRFEFLSERSDHFLAPTRADYR